MEVSGRACLVSRVVRRVAVGVVVGLLLAGCSEEDPRPRMAPTPSPSPTVSESPSVVPTPTEVPEVLGPEETVRAWIEAQNTALRSGDLSQVEALSARACHTCRQLVRPIRDVYDAGGSFETQGWIVDAAKIRDPAATPVEVDAAVTISAGRTFPSSTEGPVAYKADKRILRFTLTRDAGRALVSFVGFLS